MKMSNSGKFPEFPKGTHGEPSKSSKNLSIKLHHAQHEVGCFAPKSSSVDGK
jgi:hypothetical protein